MSEALPPPPPGMPPPPDALPPPNTPPPPLAPTAPRNVRLWAAALAAVGVLIAVIALAGAGGAGDDRPAVAVFGASLADPVPYDGRSPALIPPDSDRVVVELPRPALAARPDAAELSPRRQREYVASLQDEAASLISALEARNVRLKKVVTFERTFHGFAATVDAEDFPRLQSLGVRVRPNRRFFPAFSEPIPVTDDASGPDVTRSVTVLAGGVAGAEGYDAVDDDDDPAPGRDPRDPERTEVGGQALTDAVRALGAGTRVIRVSTLIEGEEYARTDTLLAGLERTVDPDGDGDTSDHDPVALVGVSAPYAGFADAPESIAVRGAEKLGTLVIAPAGHDGAAEGAYGTIGSPAAAAIAVAPLSPPDGIARTTLQMGDVTVAGAAVLAGSPPAGPLPTARPVAANNTAALLVASSPELQDRLVIVEAGPNPGARVAAAAGAGAAAVLLAEPREGRPLPTMPAGRVGVPVLGVTGAAAQAALETADETEARTTELVAPEGPLPTGTPSRYGSEGPAYDGTPKPDLTRPGSIAAAGSLISGAAVAAAHVAVEAVRLDSEDGRSVREQLLPPDDDAEPRVLPAPEVGVSSLAVQAADGATSVQFTLGSFTRGDPTAGGAGGTGTTVVPAASLELTLTREGDDEPVERLTPPGGQRGLLPGAYAYTLPRPLVKELDAGSYTFRVRAAAPRQTTPTIAVSPAFEVP